MLIFGMGLVRAGFVEDSKWSAKKTNIPNGKFPDGKFLTDYQGNDTILNWNLTSKSAELSGYVVTSLAK